jgi:hypothetical protein
MIQIHRIHGNKNKVLQVFFENNDDLFFRLID